MPEPEGRLRITSVAFRYPPKAPGGAGIYAHRLGRRIASKGHAVRAVTASDAGPRRSSYQLDGIDVRVFKVASRPPMSKLTYVHNPGTLRKDFGEGDVAHVHNFGAFSTTLFKALRRQGGHRAIVWMAHDVQLMGLRVPESEFDAVMRGGEDDLSRLRDASSSDDLKSRTSWRNMGPNIDRYIAISGFMYNLFQAAGIDKGDCRLVYNGIDLDGIPATDVPEEPNILFMGGVTAIKGVDLLVEAMPRVLESVPDAKLTFVGTGDLEGSLRNRADELGIGDRVVLAGHHGDVGPFLRDCQVLVLPSRVYEICSLVILEAMAAGRPVVASDRGGNPEQVDDGRTGLLFRAGDAEDLAEKLVTVLGSRDTAASMGTAGRRRAEGMFSLDRAADETIGVYRELLER